MAGPRRVEYAPLAGTMATHIPWKRTFAFLALLSTGSASASACATATDVAAVDSRESGTPPGDWAPAGATSKRGEGIELTVTKTLPVAKLGSITSGTGTEFLIVYLLLRNVEAEAAIRATARDFQLVSADTLITDPDPVLSATIPHACRADQRANVGGALSCAFVFRVDVGTGAELKYRLPSGRTLGVALSSRQCNALVQRGAVVVPTIQRAPKMPPDGAEQLPDGTYVLTKSVHAGAASRAAVTLRIAAGRFEHVADSGGPGHETTNRHTGATVVDGSSLTLNFECSAEIEGGSLKRLDTPESYVAASTTFSKHRFDAERAQLYLALEHEHASFVLQYSKVE
jgi:hypothetical protein